MAIALPKRLVLGALVSFVAACGSDGVDTAPCPENTIRSGQSCLPVDSDGNLTDAAVGDVEDAGRQADTSTDVQTDVVENDIAPDVNPGDTEPTDSGTDTGTDSTPLPDTVDDTATDTTVEPDVPPETPTSLPFAVDQYWAPSGYMGDAETPGTLSVLDDACTGNRAGDGLGICRQFTWDQTNLPWAGVFWQYPDANWGTLPGLPVPEGATSLTFWAWGAVGGEQLKFLCGINDADGFAVETANLTLSASPTQYTIDLSGVSIGSEVVGGFGWVTDANRDMSFFLDDIQWR